MFNSCYWLFQYRCGPTLYKYVPFEELGRLVIKIIFIRFSYFEQGISVCADIKSYQSLSILREILSVKSRMEVHLHAVANPDTLWSKQTFPQSAVRNTLQEQKGVSSHMTKQIILLMYTLKRKKCE